jgi:Fe2+ or Zn2+ uptake regulation protein
MEQHSPPHDASARLSKGHRTVLDIVAEQGRGCHLTMADVHRMAQLRRPGFGVTTVYRGLLRLVQLGLISEVRVAGTDTAYYEPASEPHAHFRCDRCGSIGDIDFDLNDDTLSRVGRENGVRVRDALVTLRGLCASCS